MIIIVEKSEIAYKIQDIEARINLNEILEGELPDAVQDFVLKNYDEVTALLLKLLLAKKIENQEFIKKDIN